EVDAGNEAFDDGQRRDVAAKEEVRISQRERRNRDQQTPVGTKNTHHLDKRLINFAKVLDNAAGVDELEGLVGERNVANVTGNELTRESTSRELASRGANRIRGEVDPRNLDAAKREVEGIRGRPGAGLEEATRRLRPETRDESKRIAELRLGRRVVDRLGVAPELVPFGPGEGIV